MADPFNPEDVEKYKALFKREQSPRVFGTPKGLASLEAEKSGLASFLGVPDYDAQLDKSREDAKLQFYLQMAQRGFAAAGAAPRRGESTVSTLSRELFSPLAGDASKLAGQFTKERRAIDTAKKAGDRQIRLAALQNVQSRQDKAYEYDAKATVQARNLVMQLAKTDDEVSTNYTVAGENVPVIVRKGYDGGLKGFFEIDGKTPIKRDTVKVFNASKAKPITSWITDVKVKGPEGAWIDAPGTLRIADSTGQNSRVVHKGLTLNFNESSKGYNAKIVKPGSKDSLYVSPVTEKALPTQELADLLGLKNLDLTKTITRNTHRPKGDSGAQAYSTLTIGGATYDLRKMGDSINGKLVRTYDPVAQTIIKDGTTYNLAELTTYADPKDTAKITETDAERQSRSRLGLLLNSTSEIQVGKVGGKTSAYNAKAAFYFDPAAHLAGNFAFKYIPPGTDINDRSKDVTITNPSIIKLINNKLRNVSDTILKADFGDTAADTQRTRLQDGVRRMLSLPASTVFGATPIEVIGTNAENQVIGYTPSADAISPATVIDNAKTAMATLGNASERYTPLLEVLKPLPDVDNEADSRTTWGRLKTAASAFPESFKYTGEGKPGTDNYDEQMVQQRQDIEAGLPNAALNPQASTTDHRAVLQKVAAASREKREKVQNTNSEVGNDLFLERLTLRDALLAFKNAAMESNVSGFVTGTLAGGAAKLGFAKFIAGKGSKHWARLKVASDRMSSGYSRRAGREFGDTRISNYDAKDYKKLLPSIENDEAFNSILIEDALKRNGVELRQLMENGGDFGWTREQLQNAAKAGVDFATLKTKKNWHGHGFYGKNRYTASRQYTPTLSNEQRSNLRTQGQLNDTMYDGLLTVPSINYSGTNLKYAFSPYTPKKGNIPASGTKTTVMDAPQFEEWLKGRAGHFNVEVEEMRRRVVQGILSYNVWRQ
jgi:hypothetical protein